MASVNDNSWLAIVIAVWGGAILIDYKLGKILAELKKLNEKGQK